MVRMGSAVGAAEAPTKKFAFVTPPNFAPDGPARAAKMQVGMALTPNSLARRKPGVQIPSPPPPTLQVRASPTSSGAALTAARGRAAAASARRSPARKARSDQATRPGPLAMTTERGRRLRSELRVRCDARQSRPEATLGQADGRAVRGYGRTARSRPLLAVWLPAASTCPTESPVQTPRTRTRNVWTPMRGTGRPHPDIGQRTRGHRMRGHWTVTPDTGHRASDTGHRTCGRDQVRGTGRPRHGRHPDRHPGPPPPTACCATRWMRMTATHSMGTNRACW
jgi:hypothetical protein